MDDRFGGESSCLKVKGKTRKEEGNGKQGEGKSRKKRKDIIEIRIPLGK